MPFIIAVVAGEPDPSGASRELSFVTRAVRVDFGAEFTWIEPRPPQPGAVNPWQHIDAAGPMAPGWVKALVRPQSLGTLAQLRDPTSRVSAALAHVAYAARGARTESWLLLLSPKLSPGLPVDVASYAANHPDFPNQSVVDQFFDDNQWESYRMVGLLQGTAAFA